jgi:hypothetical protein
MLGAALLGKSTSMQVSHRHINKWAIQVDQAYFIPGLWSNVKNTSEGHMENKKIGLMSLLGGTSWHRYRWWRELLERHFEVRLYSSGQASAYMLSVTLLSPSKAAMVRIHIASISFGTGTE